MAIELTTEERKLLTEFQELRAKVIKNEKLRLVTAVFSAATGFATDQSELENLFIRVATAEEADREGNWAANRYMNDIATEYWSERLEEAKQKVN